MNKYIKKENYHTPEEFLPYTKEVKKSGLSGIYSLDDR